jgi:hypothetical protein
MSYDIEMLWECSLCRHRGNRGLKDRYCGNCGHKKDASDSEYMPDDMSEAAALSGEASRLAGAGPDRVCEYCESVQNPLNRCCSNCGATSRNEPSKRYADRVDTASPVSSVVDSEPPQGIFRYRFWLHRAMALTVGILLVVWLGWWLFAPHTVTTHVSALHWQHDTLIERYAVYPHEGWYPEGGALEVMPLGSRVHHYDHVHVGSHQESYRDSYTCGETCSTSPSYTTCSSNGNGTARCTKHGGNRSCSPKYCSRTAYRTVQDYRDEPRYQMWFGWRSWGWAYNRTVSRSGVTNPIWPSDAELRPERIGDGERERSDRQSSYKVTFREDDGDTHDIEPKSAAEFLQYPSGKSVRLKVNHVGSVEVLP